MGKDLLHYDRMVQEALRGVVRKALTRVVEVGLPGGHHFFLTFRTDHPGAMIPASLRAQHPHEMTVALQHQFRDLEVGAKTFAVTLSFDKVQNRITVPFTAITRFTDPWVNFGLQFQALGADELPLPPPPGLPAAEGPAAGAPGEARAADQSGEKEAEVSDKVVTLDTFRKG